MKWRLALNTAVSLLALTSPAWAMPQAFGFIGSVFATAATSFFSSATVLKVGLTLATLALNALMSRQKKPKANPADYKNTFENSAGSEVNAGGRVQLAGLKAFGNTAGSDTYRWIWHARGPALAPDTYFVGGREVTVEADGGVSSPPWVRPGGLSWMYLKTNLGTGTEIAHTELITAFPALWTGAHVGKGIYSTLVRYISPGYADEDAAKKTQKIYAAGFPEVQVRGRVGAIYDPRDIAQNADNAATWKHSYNGPLWAVHILRRSPQFTSVMIDWDLQAIEAGRADEPVATLTGSEPRSRFSGVWLSETDRADTMEDVLRSIGGEIVTTPENKYYVRLIDDVRTPEIVFTLDDLPRLGLRYGNEAVKRKNICRLKYYSPERNFELATVDLTGLAWGRIEEEVAKYGPKYFDVELPFCPSSGQGQRIARRLFAMERARTGSLDANYAGMAAWGAHVVSFPLPTIGRIETAQIGSPRENQETGRVDIPFAIIPALDPWVPAHHEAPAPPIVPAFTYEAAVERPAAPVSATVVNYPSTSTYETRIRFESVPDGTIAEAAFRTYTGGEPDALTAMTEYFGYDPDLDGRFRCFAYYDAVDLRGRKADFTCRFFNAEEDGSYPSPAFEVASLAIDNTACSAPALVLSHNGSGTFTATVNAQELRLAAIRIQTRINSGVWNTLSTTPARPDVAATGTFGSATTPGTFVECRAYALTSNGTLSPASTIRSFTFS